MIDPWSSAAVPAHVPPGALDARAIVHAGRAPGPAARTAAGWPVHTWPRRPGCRTGARSAAST